MGQRSSKPLGEADRLQFETRNSTFKSSDKMFHYVKQNDGLDTVSELLEE